MSVVFDIPFDFPAENADKEYCENIILEKCLEQCIASGDRGVEITNELYHSLDGISGSKLPLLMHSNRHLDNAKLFNLGDTEALKFCSLVHTLCLEPEEFQARYVVAPLFDGRTNEGKAKRKAFNDDNRHKTIITGEDFSKAKRMSKNVRAMCSEVIETGTKERSWFVDADGLILKIRPDIYNWDTGDDFDIKSISPKNNDLSDSFLERHIKHYNYHLSAGFRTLVRRELGMPTSDCYLIFVSTAAGHMVRTIKIAPKWLEESEIIVADMLQGRRFYLQTGIDIPLVEIDDSRRKIDSY